MSVAGRNVAPAMADLVPAVFPRCHHCGHFADGPAAGCVACARPRLELVGPDACTQCGQRLTAGNRCPNELCRRQWRRIGPIHAIAYHSGALRLAISEYKYLGVRTWAVIFARLLLGWLEDTMAGDPPDLIVANPSFACPGGQEFAHTEAVLEAAASQSARWLFDTAVPRAIVKTRPTLKSAQAAGWSKRAAATDLRDALAIPDRARTRGRFVLVYDDVCATGSQLDAVADCLLDQGGAARVEGIVLARAPWRGSIPPARGPDHGTQR
jgi:predicted amidophosphoribosyltransferase